MATAFIKKRLGYSKRWSGTKHRVKLADPLSLLMLVGLSISIFYVGALTMGSQFVSRAMHVDAVTLMSSIGQTGSVVFPLTVHQKKGNKHKERIAGPTVVALFGGETAV